MLKGAPEPVDAVITWVDGHDPLHHQKLTTYLTSLGLKNPKAAEPTRFNQCGEIDYCLRSIMAYAPWIRTIYIVTDQQSPSILNQLDNEAFKHKIRLIDHKHIFKGYEQYLPTFNSIAIESMLWRIDGLSNQFIYLNDDCPLIAPVAYEDFFRDGKIVLRGHWKKQWDKRLQNIIKKQLCHWLNKPYEPLKDNEHRMIQENTARLAGFDTAFFHLPHIPFPLLKDKIETYYLKHPNLLFSNLSFRLRDAHQFWPVSLAHHLAIKDKHAIIDNSLTEITINGACHSLEKIKKRLSKANKKSPFFCMQSMDQASDVCRQYVESWLNDH